MWLFVFQPNVKADSDYLIRKLINVMKMEGKVWYVVVMVGSIKVLDISDLQRRVVFSLSIKFQHPQKTTTTVSIEVVVIENGQKCVSGTL